MQTDDLHQILSLTLWGVDVGKLGTGALVLIMLTMGLTLEGRDFRVLLVRPRPVIIGLVGQVVLLPLVAAGLIWLIQPDFAVAMGLLILACCPGGATSNFFTYLARGDVALSVVLTALSGLITVFTIPIFLNIGFQAFAGEGRDIHLPVIASMLRIFSLVVLPMLAGMGVRRLSRRWAGRIEPVATRLSFVIILATMVILFAFVADRFAQMLIMAGPVTVSLNLVMMLAGLALARAFRLSAQQGRSLAIEIGIQNYILSVVIAVALLKAPDFAIAPIVYLFTMYVTVFTFIALCRRRPLPAAQAA